MPTAEDYLQRLGDLMGQPVNGSSLEVAISASYNTPIEARQLIKQYGLKQKELRLLKREMNLTKEQISKVYVSQRIAVGKTVGWGVTRAACSDVIVRACSAWPSATASPWRRTLP